MPATYAPPHLDERQLAAIERGEYDFLIATRKPLMRSDEVQAALHRKDDFVRALADAGRLEVHRDKARGERKNPRYTRRSLIMHMVETGDYEPSHIVMRVEVVMKTFSTAHLDRLIAFATRQKNLIR